jgi:hypothetical protein
MGTVKVQGDTLTDQVALPTRIQQKANDNSPQPGRFLDSPPTAVPQGRLGWA